MTASEFIDRFNEVMADMIESYNPSVADIVTVGSSMIALALSHAFKECTERHSPEVCLTIVESMMRDIFRTIINATKLAMVIK